MELRVFLRLLMQKWWLVLVIFLLTLVGTALLTARQPTIYRSQATFVVRIDDSLVTDKETLDALATVSRQSEIATTYAEVVNSRRIEQAVANELELSAAQRKSLTVSGRVVVGTNVLKITGEGEDPVLVREFTNAIGAETAAYVQRLYPTYTLEPLDYAVARRNPVAPNRPLNLTLGAIAGLILGAGVALLAIYLQSPTAFSPHVAAPGTAHPMSDGRSLRPRLRQEVSRSQRQGYPLAFALVRLSRPGVSNRATPEQNYRALRHAASQLGGVLRPEDTLFSVGDDALALILPDLSADQAREIVEAVQASLEAGALDPLDEEGNQLLWTVAGIATYREGDQPDDLVLRASQALTPGGAERESYGFHTWNNGEYRQDQQARDPI